MRKHRALLGIVLISLTLFAAFYAFEQSERHKLETFLHDIQEAISRDLPPGSQVKQVEAFLDKHHIPYSPMKKYDGSYEPVNGDKSISEKKNVRHLVKIFLRNYYNVFILKFSVSIDFYFDEEEYFLWNHVSTSGDGIPLPW